jgi:NhaP-type Na+/H+ or K+/H+ antiporter/mannitol/fructose-specific phosphotransferase system IIA component (Ntr-type)
MPPISSPLLLFAAGGSAGPLLSTVVTAIVAGIGLLIVARRLNIPAIVLLLAGGVLLGPLVWGDSAPIQPASLGDGLGVVVSLAVGLILFEGGLTLDPKGYSSAPTVIRRLLTIGVAVTWLATAISLHYICDVKWGAAITTASLVIVTGPTVVGPLLKRLGVTERLANILRWEAVLIDPIGVFAAILCYEWLIQGEAQNALVSLGARVVGGVVVGVLGGAMIALGMRSRRWVPADLLNMFVLAGAVLSFGLAEAIRPEAGLLSVTVAGFVVGLVNKGAEIERVHKFKEELTNLLIALVFMLLAARLGMDQIRTFGWPGFFAVLSVIFLVRPISIALCTLGQDLGARERVFLSWIAPRGVVAASMASLIAIHLEARGSVETARMVETFTWSVIVGTIVLQGLSAGFVVKLLGLKQPRPTGWAIVGAHALSRALARALSPDGSQVLLVDTNAHHVADATQEGLRAIVADARDTELAGTPEFGCVGNLLALTDNEDLNLRICSNWASLLGQERVFRWADHEEPDHLERRGRPLVWGDEPSAIAFDIHRGSRMLARLGPGHPEGRTLLEVDEAGQASREATIRLALLPREAILAQGFSNQRVWDSAAPDFEALTAEIHERLEEFLELETRVHPAVVEDGVAVAHAHSDLVEHPQLSAVRLEEPGLKLAPDPEPPVRVLFVLVSPQGNSRAHLAAIGELARLLADDVSRKAFAESGEELARVISEALEANAARR